MTDFFEKTCGRSKIGRTFCHPSHSLLIIGGADLGAEDGFNNSVFSFEVYKVTLR